MRIIKECAALKCAHSHNGMIESGVMTIREKYHDLKRKIYSKLLNWKNECQGTKAIMVEAQDVLVNPQSWRNSPGRLEKSN